MKVSDLLELKAIQTNLGIRFDICNISYFINFKGDRADVRIVDSFNIFNHKEFKDYL